MKSIQLKYGEYGYNLDLPDGLNFTMIHPPLHKITEFSKVNYKDDRLLKNKIQDLKKNISDISIGICINDKTRPVPYHHILPDLLNHIHSFGIEYRQITFFIANGTHIPENPKNQPYIPDFVKNNYKIVSHDCDDRTNIQHLGSTSRGTPVFINRLFMNCDIKIAVGNIEPHHFAGYSGAVKSVAIGLAGRETILENHKLLVNDEAKACNFWTNPLRQDIEEIGSFSNLDFCLNSIKDCENNLIQVLWGNPSDVLKTAIPIVDGLFLTNINHKFDVVIASAGGYPKDINLYQSQKAVTNAAKITKKNGLVILVAECKEGSGSPAYENNMKNFSSPFEIIQEYEQGKFEIGPHKALQFAFIQSQVTVGLFSCMDAEIVKSLLLLPITNLEKNLHELFLLNKNLSLAIMTDAVITIPKEGVED
jgi:nickel-dependent lactate racemase